MPYNVNIGDGADALGQNQYVDALDGTYWVSGWDATLGTGSLEVDIAAGEGAVDATTVTTASTQTIDFTGDPDATDPRKAVIYVDSGGTVQKSLGTPQPVDPTGEIRFRTWNPSPPASVSGVVVAEVWLAANETTLASADLRDRRVSNSASINATPNTPDWTEDANSPATSTSLPLTVTLDGTYDLIEVHLKADMNTSGQIGVQVNGDTGSNYEGFEIDGTTPTQDNWILSNTETGIMEATFKLTGVFGDNASIFDIGGPVGAGASGWILAGGNNNVTSPISSITFVTPFSTNEITVEVYGRNIG